MVIIYAFSVHFESPSMEGRVAITKRSDKYRTIADFVAIQDCH